MKVKDHAEKMDSVFEICTSIELKLRNIHTIDDCAEVRDMLVAVIQYRNSIRNKTLSFSDSALEIERSSP